MSEKMKFHVIHLTETDGDIKIHICHNVHELNEYTKDMDKSDYSIISGGKITK